MAAMASQSRPEPMNASPYHSKVRVVLKFADSQFPAGGMVTGKMELECKAEKGLGISVIMVELYAIEELTSRDHSATSTFLHSRRLFQGPGLPPSNSVHPFSAPGDPPLPSTYYHARRGITSFLFQLPLPDSSPSSIDFGSGLARLRYEVRASVGVFWKGEKKLVTDTKQVDVVERFEDINRADPEGVIVGEGGKIWIQGKVLDGFMVAGQPACIQLQVKNHSSKKNSGLSVTLTRELYLPNLPPGQKQPLQLSDTIVSVSFRGPDYIIQPGAEGVANLVVDVPKNARGVKGGRRRGDGDNITDSLFEVRCAVSIKLSMGIGSKDIRLDLPVIIIHPSVVPDFPPPDMYSIPPPPMSPHLYDPTSGLLYQPPMSPAPYLDRPTSPYAYPMPPMSPPIPLYVEHGQVWLPPPPMSPLPANFYNPASYYAHPHASLTPYESPIRPSSAEPRQSQPLYDSPLDTAPPAPLIPMPTGNNNNIGEREEGKGERASRIAHHLRMSSRHRSASPPAHRYHLVDLDSAAANATHALISHPDDLIAPDVYDTASPSSSPILHTRKNLTLLPLPTGGDVASPRPMLSPKLLFSKDPFEHTTQVENLERIAAEHEQEEVPPVPVAPALSARSVSGETKDKTLPKPPVPSGKENMSTPRIHANALFPPDLVEAGADETPPTPTLAAVTSLKVPRGLRIGNTSTGLDALEARLLAEVGTRKPDKNERAPDVRTVLPIAIPRPTDVEPPVDSAISSLSLPGLGVDADEKTLKRGNVSRGGNSDRELDVDPGGVSTRARDSKETMRGQDSRETKKTSSGTKKRGDKYSSKQTDNEGDVTKDKELQKLRKAAQGRIAAWLGGIDPDEPPQTVSPPPATPPPRRGRSPRAVRRSPSRSPARSGQVTPDPPASPLREKKTTEVLPEAAADPPKDDAPEGQAAPNPRSSGFVAIGTMRSPACSPQHPGNGNVVKTGKKTYPFDEYLLPKASSRAGLYPPHLSDPEVKYDVRSARGGKGGIVTSVAAMWASATQSSDKTPPPQPKPHAKPPRLAEQWKAKAAPDAHKAAAKPKLEALKSPKPPIAAGGADGRPKVMRPAPKTTHSTPALISSASSPMATSVADFTAKRARMIKSPSVPAVVSSSTATPMLSSTASLARPSPVIADGHKANVKLPPTISEMDSRVDSQTPTSAPASSTGATTPLPGKSNYAFGQARLRELIKRYQGQVNS